MTSSPWKGKYYEKAGSQPGSREDGYRYSFIANNEGISIALQHSGTSASSSGFQLKIESLASHS